MKKSAVKSKQSDKVASELRFIARHGLCLLFGIATSCCSVFSGCSPFGISLVSALPSGYLASGTAGAIAGYLLFGTSPIKYVCAIFVVAIIRYSLSNYKRLGEKAIFSPLVAMVCCLIVSLTYAFSSNADVMGIALSISESLFAGAGAFFIDNAFGIKLSRGIRSINGRELSCAVLAACMVLSGLTRFDFYDVSPARIVMLYAVLFCARVGKEAWGSMGGVLAGLVGVLSGGGAYLAGAYASAGLVGGVFSQFGQLASAAAFFLSGSVVAITLSEMSAILPYVYELAIASVLFALTPQALSIRVEGLLRPIHDKVVSTEQGKAVSQRLSGASKAVFEAAESIDTVTQTLISTAPDSTDEVAEMVYHELCEGCGLHNFCYEQNTEACEKAFEALCRINKEQGKATSENAPPAFMRRCIKSEEFLQLFNAFYYDFAEKSGAEKRAAEIRERIYSEFGLAARILGDVAQDYENDELLDRRLEPRVMSVMNSYRIFPSKILCRVGKTGKMSIEVTVPEMRGRIDKFPITKTLCEACRRSFEMPKIVADSKQTVLIFREKPAYKIKIGSHRIAGDDSRISGDCCRTFELSDGKQALMISDGMGSGGRAAVDAAMSVNIISKLAQAGMSFVCALEIANATLLSGGETEALTTIDLAIIDAFSGRVEFLKAGATRSFVRHNYRAVPIEAVALPIG
ncbi:MAG: SpoIIE family protein phosphatase, partial [Clostridia bacterium]|nr:SpoIIE family protein phosphatase [Clostridia bacterium]